MSSLRNFRWRRAKLSNLVHESRSFLYARNLWNNDTSKFLDLNQYGAQRAVEILSEASLVTWF